MEIIDGMQLLKFLASLTFVLALMAGLFLILKRIQSKGPLRMGSARRLRVTEVLQLDSRHRAILLRRDNKEHLVILSPSGETVIESGIIYNSDNANTADDATTEQANENIKDAA